MYIADSVLRVCHRPTFQATRRLIPIPSLTDTVSGVEDGGTGADVPGIVKNTSLFN